MSDILENAKKIRNALEKEIIQFVPDEEAVNYVFLHPYWNGNSVNYNKVGFRVKHNGVLYSLCIPHISQPDWAPPEVPNLWAPVLTSEDPNVVLPWERPESNNGYKAGDKVTHNGYIWESTVDNNVWEPGVEGTEALWINKGPAED